MKRKALALAVSVCLLSVAPTSAKSQEKSGLDAVTLPSPGSPLIALRLMFSVGSIHDPVGKEGLAALTALMIGDAGTQKRSYSELVEILYPMAASIEVATDREVTVLSGTVHRDKLAEYTLLLSEAILAPGFAESDFERNKDQLLAYLTNTLRAANDELLGLEAIQQVVFADHPYGHAPQGTVEGLGAITLEDVKNFYRKQYTQATLMLGVAGGYPEDYVANLKKTLSALPEGDAKGLRALSEPAAIEGRRFTVIDKETDSTAIHFGYALPINRSHPDYYALMVANSYLGEHRTFHGRLMHQLRGKRGLNYGDYSYIEYWRNPPFTSHPSPNVPRRQQYFSVWIRPVVPDTAHFALRNALYEVDRLSVHGLTKEEFELARDFLVNYSKLWAQTLSRRLGFLMDSHFYGTDYYIDDIDRRLKGMSVEEVNAAARKYLQTENFQAVFVTDDAEIVKAYLEQDEPSPMSYNSDPDKEVLEADKTIRKIPVQPAEVRILSVHTMFQK
ncbi:MAG: pitrilysin family protein [Thermoanaerobaculia bacterium]